MSATMWLLRDDMAEALETLNVEDLLSICIPQRTFSTVSVVRFLP